MVKSLGLPGGSFGKVNLYMLIGGYLGNARVRKKINNLLASESCHLNIAELECCGFDAFNIRKTFMSIPVLYMEKSESHDVYLGLMPLLRWCGLGEHQEYTKKGLKIEMLIADIKANYECIEKVKELWIPFCKAREMLKAIKPHFKFKLKDFDEWVNDDINNFQGI